jgi:hypothetical protein
MTNSEKTIVPWNEEVVATPENPSEETIPAKEEVKA